MAYLNYALILLLLAFLVYWGVVHMLAVAGQRSPSLRIPMLWAYLAMPCGGALMFIEFLGLALGIRPAPLSHEG